jgi:integrase
MASLEGRSGRFRLVFRFGRRKHQHALKTKDRAEADACLARLEENLRLLERGRLVLPPGADLAVFLLSDGKLSARPEVVEVLTLANLFRGYREAQAQALEPSSLDTIATHMRHLTATLGAGFPARTLTLAHLQGHVDRRSQEKGRGGKSISPTTIKKEVATLSGVWTWANRRNLVAGPFPNRGLVYSKTEEKPPFRTWAEIERELGRGGLSDPLRDELWHSLFLTLPEIQEVLQCVRAKARHGFIYPMFAFAAHTGARRSEILRSRIGDFDFGSQTVLIHERKRERGRRTIRRVPLSPFLARVMQDWMADHPGGVYTICHRLEVPRSKKTRSDFMPLTRDESNDHFQRTLAGSRWARMRGWHIFRHSFASNCAARGVDQRLIDAWMGHQTDEMRKRYRHLLPDQQARAIQSVFGDGP